MRRERSPGQLRTAVFVGLTVIALASCSGSPDTGAPLPPPTPIVDVKMTEYHFDFSRTVPAGRVVLQANDAGQLAHQLSVFEMAADMPSLEAQLNGSVRRSVDIFGSILVRPGKTGRFAVDLAPGRRYAFVCLLAASDGVLNARKGMNFEVQT
jgi:uncharacterized cupredoxin-like copper-binding protein